MTDLKDAVAKYMAREKAAMETIEGADIAELIEQVAQEEDLDTAVLTEAILDATLLGAGG